MSARGGPPRLWRWVLSRSLPAEDREFVLGDLDEEYARMEESGASRWYRSQALRSAASSLFSRIPQRGEGTMVGMRSGLFDRLHSDARYALRTLARSRGLAALVVATLGAGTGAAIAIFTVANEVLFTPLGYDEPDELVMLWESSQERGWVQVEAAPANVQDWRARVDAFEDVAHFSGFRRGVALEGPDGAEHVWVGVVSGNFFDVLGVPAALGRVFTNAETWADAAATVLLSHAVWQSHFAGDPGVLGRELILDGSPHIVIGVMPEWFEYPFTEAAMWVTTRWAPSLAADRWFRQAHVVRAVARLRDGATVDQARSELEAVAAQLETEHPDLNAGLEAGLTPLQEFLVQGERTPLLLLLGAVGLLMLIAVANVANLLLVRAGLRTREIAVRASLGATRRRVVQQLVTESTLLAVAGTLAGLGVAWTALAVVRSRGFEGLPPLTLVPDARVMAFVLALAVVSALVFGTAPALRASRVDLQQTLAEAGRSGSAARARLGASNAIVTAQIALAVMLTAAAGLTFRSLAGLGDITRGVRTTDVLTFQLTPPSARYDDAARARFAIQLRQRLAEIPGVIDAGVGRGFPLTGYGWSGDFTIRDWPPGQFGTQVRHREALPGYFTTMGVEVLEGELYDEVPPEDRPLPVVVNRAFAERYFAGSSPVGRQLANVSEPTDNTTWYEIVAVVENERMEPREETVPEIISHVFADVPGTLSVVVAADIAPLSLVPAVRGALRELDPSIPLMNVRTMEAIRRVALSRERLMFTVFGVLALCALALACVGVYGVASQATRARDREVGIRVALGATRPTIQRQLVIRGLGWVAGGVLLGVAGALTAGRLLESLLFGVQPRDPTTLVAVAALLGATGVVATYLPARRSSHVDPASVLREE